jgi:hypothetical protein
VFIDCCIDEEVAKPEGSFRERGENRQTGLAAGFPPVSSNDLHLHPDKYPSPDYRMKKLLFLTLIEPASLESYRSCVVTFQSCAASRSWDTSARYWAQQRRGIVLPDEPFLGAVQPWPSPSCIELQGHY